MSDLKKYVIRPGATFRMPNQDLKVGGEVIELPSDVAAAHANTVDPHRETEPEAEPAAQLADPA